MKAFLSMSLIFCSLLNFTKIAYGQGGGMVGNGGSGSESQLFAEEASYRQILTKIKLFFAKHPELQEKFPQFETRKLVELIGRIDLRIVNEKLVDKDDLTRTCLNYPGSNVIECNYTQLQKIRNSPKAQYVLMFHEVLGLLGVEETSPANPKVIDGYKISKELAPYVTKVANYDLRMQTGKEIVLVSGWTAEKVGVLKGRLDSTGRKWWIDVLLAPVFIVGTIPTMGAVWPLAYGSNGYDNGFLKSDSMHLKEDSFEDAVREFKELKTKCEKTIRTWFPKGTGILTSTRSVFYDGHEYYCGRPGTNGVEGRMPRFERKEGNQYFITIYRRQAKMVNR